MNENPSGNRPAVSDESETEPTPPLINESAQTVGPSRILRVHAPNPSDPFELYFALERPDDDPEDGSVDGVLKAPRKESPAASVEQPSNTAAGGESSQPTEDPDDQGA